MLAGADLVPEWITAVAAATAVVVAFTVFRSDLGQRRRVGRESQARLFDVWIKDGRWSQVDDSEGPARTVLTVELQISNASGQSVRGVDGSVEYARSDASATFMLGVVGPTAPGSPEQRTCQLPESTFTDDVSLAPRIVRGLLRLDYSFTDASGNRWYRTNDGDLRFLYNLTDRRRYSEGGHLYKLWKWQDGPRGLRRRIGVDRIRRLWARRGKKIPKPR